MRRSIKRQPGGVGGPQRNHQRSPTPLQTAHPASSHTPPMVSCDRDPSSPAVDPRSEPPTEWAGPRASARNSLRPWASVHTTGPLGASSRLCTRHDPIVLDPRLRKGAPHPCSASFLRASMPVPLRRRRLSNLPQCKSRVNRAGWTLRASCPPLCVVLRLGRLRLVPRLRPSAPAVHGLRSGGHPWPALASLPAASMPPGKKNSFTPRNRCGPISAASGQCDGPGGEDSSGARTEITLPRSS